MYADRDDSYDRYRSNRRSNDSGSVIEIAFVGSTERRRLMQTTHKQNRRGQDFARFRCRIATSNLSRQVRRLLRRSKCHIRDDKSSSIIWLKPCVRDFRIQGTDV